jgi:hypothetical protein
MNLLKKKLDNIEYTIDMLAHVAEQDVCHFCKYNIKNYQEFDEAAVSFFKSKCIHCIYYKMYKNLSEAQMANMRKRLAYLKDMNKPLYNWQEDEE